VDQISQTYRLTNRTRCHTMEVGERMPGDRNRELRKIMEEKALSVGDVAEICGVTKRTVMRWLQEPGSATYVNMPGLTLRWLKMMVNK